MTEEQREEPQQRQTTKVWVWGLGFILVLFFGVFGWRIQRGGDEDTWICEKGQWVRRGNPVASQPEKECVDEKIIGGEKDEQGCLAAAGYSWCEDKQKCLREWEEPCDDEAVFALLQHLKLESNLPFSGIQPAEFTLPPSQDSWVMEGRVMDLATYSEAAVTMVGEYLAGRGLSQVEDDGTNAIYRDNEAVCMVLRGERLRVECAMVGQ
jgi:hypothetical protein